MARFRITLDTANGRIDAPNDGIIEAETALDALVEIGEDLRRDRNWLPKQMRERTFRAPLSLRVEAVEE